MSFSARVKEEIAGNIPRGRMERLSSLAALLFPRKEEPDA